MRGGRIELYDTERDFYELHDLASEQIETRQALEAELRDFQERVHPIGEESIEIQLDPETIESLRILGYGD